MTATAIQAPPLRQKINLRIVAFVAIFGLLLALPVYWWLDAELSGGVKQRGDTYVVDLKAMSTFTFDQNYGTINEVPERWRQLNGKKVELLGEIAPGGFTARGADQHFELVYSVQKCCFSGPPQIQHFIQSTIAPDNVEMLQAFGERWRGEPVRVTGTLTVDVRRDETGKITGIYHVNVEDIAVAG